MGAYKTKRPWVGGPEFELVWIFIPSVFYHWTGLQPYRVWSSGQWVQDYSWAGSLESGR